MVIPVWKKYLLICWGKKMNKFMILYMFNLKRMNKSYMFWVFVVIALVGIPFGLYQFTKDWDAALYNQIATTYNNAEDVYNIGYFVLFITYFFTVFCGATITNSIANERISKVSDLLTYHVSPVKIVYSKILALITLVLEAAILIFAECGILQLMEVIHLQKVAFFIKMIKIESSDITMICIMSIVAIFIYMLLYAIVGVCITNQQQMQFAQLPVTIILIAGFVMAYVCLNNPELVISKIMNYVPFVAPFIVGSEILNGTITSVQLIISGLIIILYIAICNYFVVKVLIPRKMIR